MSHFNLSTKSYQVLNMIYKKVSLKAENKNCSISETNIAHHVMAPADRGSFKFANNQLVKLTMI